jgi:CBS domain-containing membrane protein
MSSSTPPSSDAPSSDAPSSDAPSSDAPSSDAPSSDAPSSGDEVLELEPDTAEPPGPPPARKAEPTEGGRELPPPRTLGADTVNRELPARQWPPVTVADVMARKVIVLQPDDNLENINLAMARFRFRHLPVVDGDQKVVGLLTHRDLLHALSSSLSDHQEQRNAMIERLAKVSAVMHANPVTVVYDEPASHAGQILWDRKFGCLPVTDSDGVLVGIVTEADYLRTAVALLEGRGGLGIDDE